MNNIDVVTNLVDICDKCGCVDTLKQVEHYELHDHDTDEVGYYDGKVCEECGCFHASDGSFIQFICTNELHTNYNVKSWLN